MQICLYLAELETSWLAGNWYVSAAKWEKEIAFCVCCAAAGEWDITAMNERYVWSWNNCRRKCVISVPSFLLFATASNSTGNKRQSAPTPTPSVGGWRNYDGSKFNSFIFSRCRMNAATVLRSRRRKIASFLKFISKQSSVSDEVTCFRLGNHLRIFRWNLFQTFCHCRCISWIWRVLPFICSSTLPRLFKIKRSCVIWFRRIWLVNYSTNGLIAALPHCRVFPLHFSEGSPSISPCAHVDGMDHFLAK